jgi:hypothetical protein
MTPFRNRVIKPLKAQWLLYVHLLPHEKSLHFAPRVVYVFLRFLAERVTLLLSNVSLLPF